MIEPERRNQCERHEVLSGAGNPCQLVLKRVMICGGITYSRTDIASRSPFWTGPTTRDTLRVVGS